MHSRLPLVLLSCLILLTAIAILSWGIVTANRLDTTAQELALAAVQDTFTSDTPTVLIESSEPAYQAAFPVENLLRYLRHSRETLGPLNSLIAIRGSADVPLLPLAKAATTASYEIELEFENTIATVQVGMVAIEGRWLITNFDIFAELLSN
jgi:hypothetical protein